MRRPSKTHPLFRPNSPTKVQKEIKTHISTTPHRTLRPVAGRDTRQSIPAPDTAAFRAALARSFPRRHSAARRHRSLSNRRDQRGLAVRMRGALARSGGGGVSQRGTRAGGVTGRSGRQAALPAGERGLSLRNFPGWGFRTTPVALPRTPATHADHARRPLPRHSCSLPGCADDGLSLGRVPVAVWGGWDRVRKERLGTLATDISVALSELHLPSPSR